MADYECPACGGGFPATDAADDACPWCGEAMGAGGDSDDGQPAVPRLPDGRRYVPIEPDRGRSVPREPYEPTIVNDRSTLREEDTIGNVFGSGIADAGSVLSQLNQSDTDV